MSGATIDQAIQNAISQPKFSSGLLRMFAVAAVLLAVLGLYGAVSYQVAQRTREIGVRMALGATRTEVIGMILKRGLRVTALGIAYGIAITAALERFMATAVPGLEGLNAAALAMAQQYS